MLRAFQTLYIDLLNPNGRVLFLQEGKLAQGVK